MQKSARLHAIVIRMHTQEFKQIAPLEYGGCMVFHKIKQVSPLPEYRLSVQFAVGCTKLYDMNPLFDQLPSFRYLREHPSVFSDGCVDIGGYGVVWDDELDVSCDELWGHGVEVKTPFDGLMAHGDATSLWGLHESTLRKAISYGKLVDGVDVSKFGKQWVISAEAMNREYGAAGERRKH